MSLASATPSTTPGFEERYHFLLRKLHSLSGIVPIGVFLIEHLLTNSLAYTYGKDRFNKAVLGLHELPYLWALELFGIFLPLAFHAIYGIRIAMTSEPNVATYPYLANKRYTLQRATGYIAFLFVIVHLLKFRFAHWIGWGPEFMNPELTDKFEIARNGFHKWEPIKGFVVPLWLTMLFYVVGLWAACYHFANGIWSFCISWGIAIGEKAQKRVGFAAAGVYTVLFVWGALSLLAFAKAEAPDGSETPREVAASSASQITRK